MTILKICPKCKEPTLKSAMNVSGWLAPNMFECKSCGYVGQLYLEVDSEDYEKYKNDTLPKDEEEL